MQELKKLLEIVQTGGSVMLGTATYSDADSLKEAYPAAREAFDAGQASQTGAQAPQSAISADDKEKLKNFDAFKKRNDELATLVDALTKDPADLKRLDANGLNAVAKFEGVSVAKGAKAEDVHAAILAKRGA
jgi:hypothetical protein